MRHFDFDAISQMEKRDMYFEQMMKLSDFDSAEFLTTIETRCVSKIRLMFFDWLEKVVGQTINNVTLFKS